MLRSQTQWPKSYCNHTRNLRRRCQLICWRPVDVLDQNRGCIMYHL
jgi:hypothetical protein